MFPIHLHNLHVFTVDPDFGVILLLLIENTYIHTHTHTQTSTHPHNNSCLALKIKGILRKDHQDKSIQQFCFEKTVCL